MMKVATTIKNTQAMIIIWLGYFLFISTGSCSAQALEAKQTEFMWWEELLHPEPFYSELSITFSGDFMQHLPQIIAAQTADGGYDYNSSLEHMRNFFNSADYSLINLETTLSPSPPYRGYPCFVAPTQVASALKDAGIDIVALANNHSCDNGYKGIISTTEIIDSLELMRIGVYRDSADYHKNNIAIIQKGGIKLALLNYTYGTNGLPIPSKTIVNLIDTVKISHDIGAAKRRGATDIALIVHWGYEYHTTPNNEQKKLAQWALSNGVNMVIGSHPHVIQPIEIERDSLSNIQNIVVYSMGNFVSNQREVNCDGGMSFRIELSKWKGHPTTYQNPSYLPHWVLIDYRNGKKHYSTLPQYIGDTMHMSAQNRSMYNTFIDNAHKIIKPDSLLKSFTINTNEY
ncbi:MAG: CapA family protein [Rikenellaceae bacterium]